MKRKEKNCYNRKKNKGYKKKKIEREGKEMRQIKK